MTDDEIQQHIEDALDWADPSVDGSRISVTVDKGVVTLRGSVDTPLEKLTAERVAQRVRGVETVIDHLAVSSPADDEAARKDTAQASVRASTANLLLVISLVLATASAARADIASRTAFTLADHPLDAAQSLCVIKCQTDLRGSVRRQPPRRPELCGLRLTNMKGASRRGYTVDSVCPAEPCSVARVYRTPVDIK